MMTTCPVLASLRMISVVGAPEPRCLAGHMPTYPSFRRRRFLERRKGDDAKISGEADLIRLPLLCTFNIF